MAELDLSKAVEAIRDIFEDRAAFIAVPPNADLSEEEILTAALPHILDALAEEFERDAIFPDWDQVVAAALRYKARQVRHG